MSEKYDSKTDTLKHKNRVQQLLAIGVAELVMRQCYHDDSKLVAPEKDIFDEMTPKLKDSTYGSDEYKQFLKDMKPALDHHYKTNRHHPEHFKNGIEGMTLVDLLEMLCDWKAASERHTDGDILKSLEINKKRFNFSDELKQIFKNTIESFELK